MSVDPLAHPRTLAVLHLSNLLRDKPEQESNILRLLVNKLVRDLSPLYEFLAYCAAIYRVILNAGSHRKLRTTFSKFSKPILE